MDDSSIPPLVVTFTLLSLHALVMVGYGALTNVRVSQLREQADDGDAAARRILTLVDGKKHVTNNFQVLFVLLQIGIAGAVFALAEQIAISSAAPGWLVYGLSMLFGTVLVMVLAVFVPEAVGSSHPMSVARVMATPLALLVLLVTPLTRLLVTMSRAISALFASSSKVATVTEEEIMTLVDAGLTEGTIEAEEQEMIYSVLQLNDTRASEVMIPRIDVVAMSTDTSLEEARAMFIKSGHSRIPVYDETIDDIRGVLYAKDLLTYWHNGSSASVTVSVLMRPAYFVPETKPADELLRELQSRRVHMAIVVDEYGGTAGICTIENLIEEIIGDIRDEYDESEEAEYQRITETQYLVDASIDLDDLNDLLDIGLPIEDSDTLGGFIYTHFGRVPQAGEEIIHDEDVLLRIESVNGRRIRKVMVTKLQRDEETGEIEPINSTNGHSEDAHQKPDSAA